ncbi:MAG TPA: hypothetical protein VI383_12535, partial [Gemmatimonadales bacterium]|nr:hypothetical protein [Gemmatimonadales bacterium]
EIASALDRVPGRVSRLAGTSVLALALLGAGPGIAPAQEGLDAYARRDYAAAAQAFRTDIGRDPQPILWYSLAAAEYMGRRDAHAAAALLIARAGAPRDSRVRALWNALGREHEALRRATTGPEWPLSAAECFALALLVSWASFLVFLFGGRRRHVLWGSILTLAFVLALAGEVLRSERSGPRAVLIGGASLRVSPHGLAPARGGAPAFSVVRLIRQSGSWWLVGTGDGSGWVPEAILARPGG